MHKKLILEAFEEAANNLKFKGQNNPSKVMIAEELSDYVDKYSGTLLGERSFRDYHTEATALENKKEDIAIKQVKVVEALCRYLGYENYAAFLKRHKRLKRQKRPLWIGLSILGVAILTALFFGMERTYWMEWKEDHYEKVSFDSEKLSQGFLKVYKEDDIKDFKKITSPNCNTVFFKDDGSVNAWYGKNALGELEVYTNLGLHPETGKTLKPITGYMIKKYFCKDY